MLNITQQEFERLANFLHVNYGIDLSKKKQLIEGRLYSIVTKGGYSNFTEYLDNVLNKNSSEIVQVINKLTTNHTYFMREREHFDLFRDVILPNLERKKKNRVLSIWSAGCSSGEEPYTISMILKDYFGNKAEKWDTRVLATDISQRVLDLAKLGAYSAESVESIPKMWLKKYFKEKDGTYYLTHEIQDNVIFKTFNLMSPIQFKLKFDVIFCRNVMIYFDVPTKNALVKRFYDATDNGGYLMIGHSESIDKVNNPYRYLDVAAYVKNG